MEASFSNIPESDLHLIAGDASDRKFYRFKDTEGNSFIGMKFPGWEGGYGGDAKNWIEMQKALSAIEIPVPRIYSIQPEASMIWIEDFGDTFLGALLKSEVFDYQDISQQNVFLYYQKALDLLIGAQYPKNTPPPHPGQSLFFDCEKLFYEMNFFYNHFIEGLLLSSGQDFKINSDEIKRELLNLCQWLGLRPQVLCHRDYHSRNIMIKHDGTLAWIDFQDARMGPHTYDVVSLVRDSYAKITTKTKTALYSYYLHQVNSVRNLKNLPTLIDQAYAEELMHMGLQRNLKAIGSFAYLALIKQKKSYLSAIVPTLSILCDQELNQHHDICIGKAYPKITLLLNRLYSGDLLHHLTRTIQSVQSN